MLEAIQNNQILIIVGETGAGKTSQIPQYLHETGYTRTGAVACTQPERMTTIRSAVKVAHEMRVKLGTKVGYSVAFENCWTPRSTIIKYMTDERLLWEFLVDKTLKSYNVLMIDEVQQRSISTDILLVLVKELASKRPTLRVLICLSSKDINEIMTFSDFFGEAPIVELYARCSPVDIYYIKEPVANYIDSAMTTTIQVHLSEPLGDILVFLVDQEDIEYAEEVLNHKIRSLGIGIGELVICPLYTNLPIDLQDMIFEATPKGSRKVVLASNIAETSLSIYGIKYVIDPGLFVEQTGQQVIVGQISAASAYNRARCSGRNGVGKCFRLYTKSSSFKKIITTPEVERADLTTAVLFLRNIGVNHCETLAYRPDIPNLKLWLSMELLYAMDALHDNDVITNRGKRMAFFPIHPMLSEMILASAHYKCTEEILTIVAMLCVGNSVFCRPKGKEEEADNARLQFHIGNVGDHIAFLNVYNSWMQTTYSAEWCYDNYIRVRSLQRARGIRHHLVGMLGILKVKLTSSKDVAAITKCIICGFFLHCGQLQEDGTSYKKLKYPALGKEDIDISRLRIHPCSGLAQKHPKLIIFHETSDRYIRHVTEIDRDSFVKIAGGYYNLPPNL